MTGKEHNTNSELPSSEGLTGQEGRAQETDKPVAPPAMYRVTAFFKTLLITILVALFLKVFVVEAFRIPSGSMENTLLVGDFLLVNKLAYGVRTPRYFPLTNLAIPSVTLPLFHGVRHGDVVVFEYPGKRSDDLSPGPEYFIKRCIGLPGDTITIRSGSVLVNGREILLPSHAKSAMIEQSVRMEHASDILPDQRTVDGNNFGPTVVPRKGDVLTLPPGAPHLWKDFIEREHHTVSVASDGAWSIDGTKTSRYVIQHDYFFMLGDNRGNSLDSRYWGFVPDEYILGEALLLYWSWDTDSPRDVGGSNSTNIRWNRIGTLIR
jgi:signal peptidase I